MEYISVQQAAEKWEIPERFVQRYCNEARIDGAVKHRGVWLIPADAKKPMDMRRVTPKDMEEYIKSGEPKSSIAMPLLNTSFELGYCMDAILKIEDPDSRNIALAEYYYFSGQSSSASDIAEQYLSSNDIPIRFSACWIYAYANLALDRISRARQAMAQLSKTLENINEDTPLHVRALAICISTSASVLLHLPLPKILHDLKDAIHILSPGLRLFVLYVQAHHSYLNKQYGACIGIAETALALETELYPIPTIYLHLVATMGYISLKKPEEAREHLLEAWHIAQPDDFIEPFGEHHGLLGGMLEAVIKKEFPEDFSRIINITYSFSAGWRKVHNPSTGNNVADDLTTTEFAIAMLAARDWTNKEISSHLGISTNTVKLHVSSALQKLGISQRKELAKFMLQ